jgi:hypothetical protein
VRKRFADIGGIEADQRIHAIFGTLQRLGFDFVERAFFLRLLLRHYIRSS